MKLFKNLKKHKAEIIVGCGALLAGVLSFFITISVYPSIKSKEIKNDDFTVADVGNQVNSVIDISNENEEKIENEIIEIKEEDISTNLNLEDLDASLENNEIIVSIEDEEIFDTDKVSQDILEFEKFVEAIATNTETDKIIISDSGDNVKPKKELKFSLPISGDIILEFAKDKLVFSETLDEWITHDGVDIIGKVAEPIKAAENGIVESVKMDPRYGNTIIIKHEDGYKTIYSNLSTLDLVYVGKEVKKGDIISGVGEGFGFESKEGPHVHFEIMKDNEYQNPVKGGRF